MTCNPVHPPSRDWNEVDFNTLLSFRSPVVLLKTSERGIDTSFASWVGQDMTVRMDYGLFVDPLTSYEDRLNYRQIDEEIDGYAARIIAFEKPDGGHFVAVHIPDLEEISGDLKKLTMVVEVSRTIGKEIPLEVIRSVTFTDRD